MKAKQRKAAEVKQALVEATHSLSVDLTAVPGGAMVAFYIDHIRKLLRELAACKE